MNSLLMLHPKDNVAVAVANLQKLDAIDWEGTNLMVRDDIAAMHKVAIRDIVQGEAIVKYGQPIGIATLPIARGEHVHIHNCGMKDNVVDYQYCTRATPTQFAPKSEQAHFQGYLRANGKVGTRNYIGIISSVNCSATVASQIAQLMNDPQVLSLYENVDGVVALTHHSGCGMRSSGEGYDVLLRTLLGYAQHPNFGGIILLGLGCETMQVTDVLKAAGAEQQMLIQAFNIQETSGTRAAIEKGKALINDMLPVVNNIQRSTQPASELLVAMQCGGSDAFSGITANPALGLAGDTIVQHGGTVIYSETPEIYGAEHLLVERARTPEIANALLERIQWWKHYTEQHGFELNNNPSPGNKSGGLTTIIEKSLGAQAKSGSTQLCGVYQYAEAITEKGLVFMDSPGYDPVSVTGQVASGANVVCFTTGRGSAFGFKPVPSIKLASNTALFKSMEEDIDINCGEIVAGQQSIENCASNIFDEILAVASGKPTKSETLGYGMNEFSPWKIGAVV